MSPKANPALSPRVDPENSPVPSHRHLFLPSAYTPFYRILLIPIGPCSSSSASELNSSRFTSAPFLPVGLFILLGSYSSPSASIYPCMPFFSSSAPIFTLSPYPSSTALFLPVSIGPNSFLCFYFSPHWLLFLPVSIGPNSSSFGPQFLPVGPYPSRSAPPHPYSSQSVPNRPRASLVRTLTALRRPVGPAGRQSGCRTSRADRPPLTSPPISPIESADRLNHSPP